MKQIDDSSSGETETIASAAADSPGIDAADVKYRGVRRHNRSGTITKYLSALKVLVKAIVRVALDEMVAIGGGGLGGRIPTADDQLAAYLSRKMGGGTWTVRKRTDTYGAMGTYYSAVRDDDGPVSGSGGDDANGASGRTTMVFVKLSSSTVGGRVLDAIMGLGPREVEGYSRLIPPPSTDGDGVGVGVGVATPRCYAAEASERGSRYILVLEDLGHPEGRVRLGRPGAHLPVDDARATLVALAGMHAKFWGRRDAIPLPYRRLPASAAAFVDLIVATAIPKARRDGLIEGGSSVDRVVEASELLGGLGGLDDHLDSRHPEDVRTLVHGDAHGGNLFFTEDGHGHGRGRRIGLLDWQTYRYGNPISDVASLLVNALSTEDFVRHYDCLISVYLEALEERGVRTTLTVDEVREGICIKGAFYILGALLVLALPGEDALKEKVRAFWKHYVDLAEYIGMASVLESHTVRTQ